MKPYDPAKRKRAVSVYWKPGRRVRILDDAFGYRNKIGTIASVGVSHVYVTIRLGKRPTDWDEVAYPPGCLRLI